MIGYRAKLTDTQLLKVNSYLTIKYGLTLSGGTSDIVSSDTGVVRDSTVNSGYKYNVTII